MMEMGDYPSTNIEHTNQFLDNLRNLGSLLTRQQGREGRTRGQAMKSVDDQNSPTVYGHDDGDDGSNNWLINNIHHRLSWSYLEHHQ
jgi:hypothetical protein